MPDRYIQIAQIEVDPDQLDAYKANVQRHIDTAMRAEPGVLALYAVADEKHPSRITVFEIYRDADAYAAHLQTAHFRAYKIATEQMVRSLRLVRMAAVALGAKRA